MIMTELSKTEMDELNEESRIHDLKTFQPELIGYCSKCRKDVEIADGKCPVCGTTEKSKELVRLGVVLDGK